MSNIEPSVLGAIEKACEQHAALTETRTALARHYERILGAWIYPGAVIDIGHGRRPVPPRCLVVVRAVSGNARGAMQFRIAGAPQVTVSGDGSPTAPSGA